MYPTNIYLPVGSNFTAEICAVTPVGRGHCAILEEGILILLQVVTDLVGAFL